MFVQYIIFFCPLDFSSARLLVTDAYSIDTLGSVEGELSLQEGSGGSLGVRLSLRVLVRWCHDEIEVVLSDADLVQIWSRLRLFASGGLVFLVCGLLRSCLTFLAGATRFDKVMRK